MQNFPAANLAAALLDPTIESEYQGYKCVETTDTWRHAFAPLPSNTSVAWPGYATKADHIKVDGVEIVVQPWLGNCQKFVGMGRFPGGFGAEVGIYVIDPRGRPLPDLEGVNPLFRAMLEGIHAFGGAKLWWPKFECQYELSFKIVNPVTNKVMLEKTSNGSTFWLNYWMQPEDYARYVRDNDGQVPSPSSYRMIYTVAGHVFEWDGPGVLG